MPVPVLTARIADLGRHEGAVRWAIVRHPMWRVAAWQAAGIVWMPALAPSAALLAWWNGQGRHGRRAPGEMWPEYVARWEAEKGGDRAYHAALAASRRGGRLTDDGARMLVR